MKKNKSPLSLSWGLFLVPFYRAPIQWFKDLRIYTHRRRFLLKHGYCEQMLWETYFISQEMYKEVFTWYLNERSGDMPLEGYDVENLPTANDKLYQQLLDWLRGMDEDMNETVKEWSKDQFFDLMKKHWFDLWD